jgi:intracellular septation protein
MQLLLEFFPVVAFYVAFKMGDIYLGTATLMVTMTLSLLIIWIRTRRIPGMFGASTVLVLVLGTATLVLRSNRFIQWKPSIFLWLLATAFLVSAFVGKQPLAQRLLQPMIGESELERRDWLKLNYAWVLYGLVFGVVNIVVAYHASEDAWVNLKLFGLTGSMFLFVLAQVFWLHRRGKLAL